MQRGPQVLGQVLTAANPTIWQNLVEIRSLISVCEAVNEARCKVGRQNWKSCFEPFVDKMSTKFWIVQAKDN